MGTAFVPGPDTTRAFRDALGRFATGVTVVTAPGPVGITANSFSSLSLEPPLVLWAPAKASNRCPAFTDQCSHFAIHVMEETQAELSAGFIRNGQAFDTTDWSMNAFGVPIIEGCLARFECEKFAVYEGGDHWIVVGRVQRAEMRDGNPLLFAQGQFGRFAPAL